MKIKLTKTGMQVLGLTAIGFFIRFLWSWAPELYSDENVYAMWSHNWQFLTAYAHALVHALSVHATYAIAGAGDWQARFPSLVFGTLTIPLCYMLGKELYGRNVGFLAAVVAVFDVALITFSRFAYIEGTLLFFMLAACLTFYRSLTDNKYLVPTAALSALAIMVKANAAYLLPAFGLFYLWEKGLGFHKEKDFAKYFLYAAVVFLVLLYPYYQHFALFKEATGLKTLGEAWDAAWVMGRGPHIAHFIPNMLRWLKWYCLSVNPIALLLAAYGICLAAVRRDRPSRFLLLTATVLMVTAALNGAMTATDFGKELSKGIADFAASSPTRFDTGIIETRYLAPAYMFLALFAALAIDSIKRIRKEYILAVVCLVSLFYIAQIYTPMTLAEGRTGMHELAAFAKGHPGVYVTDDDICWPNKRWSLGIIPNVQHVYLSDFLKIQNKPAGLAFYYVKSTQKVINCSAASDDEFETHLTGQPVWTAMADGSALYEVYGATLQG